MTARALIVNHWRHYWTSSLSPIWICVGKLGEPVINQSITRRSVRAKLPQTMEAQPPLLPMSLTLTHTHTHTHISDGNKCGDNQSVTAVEVFLCGSPAVSILLPVVSLQARSSITSNRMRRQKKDDVDNLVD